MRALITNDDGIDGEVRVPAFPIVAALANEPARFFVVTAADLGKCKDRRRNVLRLTEPR